MSALETIVTAEADRLLKTTLCTGAGGLSSISNVSSTLLATTAVFRIHQVASRPRWDVVTSPCNVQSGAVLRLRGA